MIKRYDTGKCSMFLSRIYSESLYFQGKLTPYIHSLKPGDKISVKGPIVKRPWKNNEFEEVAMIAGGSGM